MGIHDRKRVSDVAELRDDIVYTILRILGPECAFKCHNTYACYKRYTDIRNITSILGEPEVTGAINKNYQKHSTIFTHAAQTLTD